AASAAAALLARARIASISPPAGLFDAVCPNRQLFSQAVLVANEQHARTVAEKRQRAFADRQRDLAVAITQRAIDHRPSEASLAASFFCRSWRRRPPGALPPQLRLRLVFAASGDPGAHGIERIENFAADFDEGRSVAIVTPTAQCGDGIAERLS